MPQTPQTPETARLDEILAHGPWVRRLARRLLDDASLVGLVDDVCQETWMVALATGPRDRSGMRAWLGGVVRNVVRRARRTERRRRDREARAAAPPDTVAPARDLVAEAELHGRVTRAVLALPEPYRSTLLMRYFEELDASAIAERLDCSASTVRNRHRRGLVLLRDALDADHGGDRASWCRALLPLAFGGPGALGAPASLTGPLTGPALPVPWKEILLMTGAKKAVVATMVLLVAGSTWWALEQETSPRVDGGAPVVRAPAAELPAHPASPPMPGVESVVEPLAAPAPTAATTTPPPDTDTRPGTLVRFSGRVVDAAGRPLDDVVVTYVPDVHTLSAWGHSVDWVLTELPEIDLPHTRTDEQGRFDIEGLYVVAPSGQRTKQSTFNPLQFPELHASGAGLARTALVLPGYTGGDLAVPDLVVLEAGGRVTGRVVDEDGASIAGASVWGIRPVVEFERMSDDISQKGHASSFLVATTDADGRWTIDGTGTCSAMLRMSAPGYLIHQDDHVRTKPGEVVDRGETVLERGGTLAGRVVDPDGRPLSGALVHANDGDLAHWDRGTDTILFQVASGGVPTDADGAFTISALTGGTQSVWADAAGFEPRRVEGVALGRRDLVIAVEPQGLLFVDIVDAGTGSPLGDATLQATRGTGIDRTPPQLIVVDGGLEATAGRFLVERPGVLSTQLTASAPGYAAQRTDAPGVAVGKTGRHVLQLVPEAVVAGVVVDAHGTPEPGAEVTLHRVPEVVPEPPAATKESGMSGFFARRDYEESLVADDLTAVSDEDGRFRFDALIAGAYELHARAPGHAPSAIAPCVLERGGRVEDVRVELAEAGILTGIVFDVDGSAARGEGVSVAPPGGQRITASAITDRDGRFRMDELPPGTWRMQVYPSVMRDVVTVPGEITEVQISVGARPLVTGRVFDPATGTGIAGARLTLGNFRVQNGTRYWSSGNNVTSDEHGGFAFQETHAGSYQLVAVLPGGATSPPIPVDLNWGDERELDVPMGTAHVAGRVRTVAGDPPDSPNVRLSGDIPTYQFAACEEDGSFLIEHVAPGAYRLQVNAKSGMQLSPLEIVVPAAGIDGVVVTVSPAATLVCTVRLANGELVEDRTQVQLVEPGTNRAMAYAGDGTEHGVARFERVVPGRYDLVVGNLGNAKHYADDTFIRWREPITLAAGEQRELEVVLDR